jgi:ribosomal protein S13
MPRPSNKRKKHLKSAARARAGPSHVPEISTENKPAGASPIRATSVSDLTLEGDQDVCSWTGGVNNHLEDRPDDWVDTPEDLEMDDLEELEGEELQNSLENQMDQESEMFEKADAAIYRKLMRSISSKEWKRAEMNRGLGYNGQSERSKQRKKKEVKDRARRDEQTRKT